MVKIKKYLNLFIVTLTTDFSVLTFVSGMPPATKHE